MGPWSKARYGVPQLPSLFGYSPPNGAAIPPHPPYRARLTTTLARRGSLPSETRPMEGGRPRPPPGESQASVTTLPPGKTAATRAFHDASFGMVPDPPRPCPRSGYRYRWAAPPFPLPKRRRAAALQNALTIIFGVRWRRASARSHRFQKGRYCLCPLRSLRFPRHGSTRSTAEEAETSAGATPS